MSTPDQNAPGPLTRKQLREMRMTGSTPVISADDAAAAAEAFVPPVPPLPRPVEAVVIAPAPSADAVRSDVPLTRRQMREQERVRTSSVPVIDDQIADDTDAESADVSEAPVEVFAEETAEDVVAEASVTEVPEFAPAAHDDDDDDDDDEFVDIAPVSASRAVDTVSDVPLAAESTPVEFEVEPEAEAELEPERELEPEIEPDEDEDDPVAAVAALGIDVQEPEELVDEDDVLSAVTDSDVVEITEGERPVVSEDFGYGVLAEPAPAAPSFAPSFDELIMADGGGSQHTAPHALIFNPPAGEGSLDGPVASTGEILITGSYELPKGIGSQGHAHGVADGKDIDAVLIDGELPPASSPTPIAASAAVSTIKPAGEVIRPPAPDKGNKIMVTLAIVAGGLALALGVVLIVAFTTKLI
ncbi:MAG: hypothetical protein QM630_00375 [Microbacterium sp.]